VSALEQWNRECAAGTRSSSTWDDLTRAAATEQRDAEIAPVREWASREQARLRANHVRAPKRKISLAERAPALSTWAGAVIAAPDRYTPLERAAAYEVAALECHIAGKPDLAAQARSSAAAALNVRRSA
jgi:hypothetical protein